MVKDKSKAGKCMDCPYWVIDYGEPFCVFKKKFASTKANHECDEFDRLGNIIHQEE